MDRFPEMKGHFLIMDNAPIHTSKIIGEIIPNSVVKSNAKRGLFLKRILLSQTIADASNQATQSSLKGLQAILFKKKKKSRTVNII
ncbi:hypothetical protein BD408DRAFT_216693, partial [Parasitella parasitica]